MEYRKLGNSGLKVSELSFGSWVTFNKQVDTSLAEKMFGTCFDAGINFFDNAEGYERGMSEIVMGEALKKLQRPEILTVYLPKFFLVLMKTQHRRKWA